MPKIPTYMASLDYRPLRGDVEAVGASGPMLVKFGEAAGEFAEYAKKAEAEAERASGTSRAMAALRQSIDEFDADTEPGSIMERYRERADGIGQQIFGTIRSPDARAQVDAVYKNLATVQGTLLQGESVRRLTERGRRDLDVNLALYADIAADARHPVQHDDAVDLALREIYGKTDAGFINAEDAGRFERSFLSQIAERQAQRAIESDPEGALASLEGGGDFAALPADRRARLLDEAGRAVQAQAVWRTTETAAARRDALIRLSKYLDALRDGEIPDDAPFNRDRIIATFGEDEGEKRWAEIEDAQASGEQMVKIRWATPREIAVRISANEVEAAQSQAAGLLALAAARRDKQLLGKPSDYVAKNPRIAELYDAMLQTTAQPKIPAILSSVLQTGGVPTSAAAPSNEDRHAAIAAYANATLAEQERLGVPESRRQVLPEGQARDLVTRILDGGLQDADEILRDIETDWGEAWPNALADLTRNGLPGEYRLLAGLDDPITRQIFARVLDAQANEPGALRAKAGADADVIDDLIRRYRDDGVLAGDHTKLAKLLAYRYAQTTEPEVAVRDAVAGMGGKTHSAGQWERGESDDIADAWLDKRAKFRRGRSPGRGTSIFDLIVDIEKGVIGGARDAAQEALEGIDSLAGLIGMDPKVSERFALPETWETKTSGGEVARLVSQFLVGFIPAFKAIKFASGGAALTRAGKFVQMDGAAVTASATVLDPLEERLSNTWQELGLPQNVLTDYLAANSDDSEAEGRFKNAIESLALGSVLAGGLAISAKILRAAKQAMTPQNTIAGSLMGVGLAGTGKPGEDAGPDGEVSPQTASDSAVNNLINPYTGGAIAFAGSNLSVDPRPIRRAWEKLKGEPWPRDPDTGRYMDVSHTLALVDGGTNDLENIRPLSHAEHMRRHIEAGDFSRWMKEEWASRKAEVAAAPATAAGKAVTRGKLKIRK